ncbi:RagB/SusD family nutrient uptake outer membrane protein [Limibacter armeniacum]|uniref:RagB/SusD family nutrient uptake outer membrane protein n=1 Tax=Limibacter armeniacum TaxID=466084 RepID=UPI002FE592EB
MKNLAYITLVLFSTLFYGCSDELLDVKNPNTLTEDQFWLSAEDAELGLNAIYAMQYKPGLWGRWIYFRYDLTSDEGYSKSPWIELGDWTRFQYVNYNFWEGNVITWRDHYKGIYRCNQVISNVPAIEMDEAQKAEIIAQAKFFRAFYYYNIAVLWEDAPIVLEPSEPDDLPEQKTVEQVWAQVEADLMDAVKSLPVQWDDANVGRPTRGAANAMLGKMYMQQRKWPEAKGALDYFFTGEGSGAYSLMPNFKDNFTHEFENNSESVFEIQFSDDNFGGGDGDEPNANMGNNRAQFFAPAGIGWSDGQARHWLVDAFKQEMNQDGELDERLRHSVFYSDIEADFGDKIYGRDWQWGAEDAWFRKYQRDYYRDNEDYHSQVNLRMIRYADILLLYAEVLNELGQTAQAYQYVDEVRARANMAPLATAYPAIGNDADLFLERLKTERVLELCGESHRWEDLKRWGDLDSQAAVDNIALRDPDFKNFEVGKNHRLPIPQVEVENNPNLSQHAEY